MITNLFSIFDPSTNFIIPLNWIRTFIGLIFVPYSFWLIPNRFYFFWNFILIKLHNEFKILLGNQSNNNGSTFIFISIFTFILFNNFLGLFPYIFTRTSHLTLSISISLPLWLRFIFYGWINNTNHIFIHIIPQGTPSILMPFIVLIETISNIIRPRTLAVRLTANIIAGHLLITLLSGTRQYINIYIITILIIAQILLLILESAVAIIQSYVIAILSTLYSREVN